MRAELRLPAHLQEYPGDPILSNQDNLIRPDIAEALTKQDLFINSALANCGASLLWQLFREGILFNRGFFLNLADFRTQPLKVA